MNGLKNKQSATGAIQINTELFTRFETAIGKQLGASEGVKLSYATRLGNPETGELYVPDTDNARVYIAGFGAESDGISTIPTASVAAFGAVFKDKPILVRKNVSGNWVCVGVDANTAEIYEAGNTGEHTQTMVDVSQFNFGTLQPYSALVASVKGYIYGDDAVIDLSTADFSASPLDTLAAAIDIPTTANRAIGVLVQLDAATSTLSYKQSAEFNSALSLSEAYKQGLLPLRDTGKWRLGYLKLSNGITEFTNSSVWAMPEFFPEAEAAAPLDATYIVQTANGTLTNEQALSALATGLMKSTTTTGVVSTVAAPSGAVVGDTDTQTLTNKTISGASNTLSNVNLASQVTGTLPIANGGTGQTSKTPAFDALAPTTTVGDIIVHNGTDNIRLAAGVDGRVLATKQGVGAGVDWYGGYVELAAASLGASQTTITFSSIGGVYQDLLLVVKARSTSTGQSVLVTFNADTGTNYSKNNSIIDNAAAETHAVSANQTNIACLNACTPSSGTSGYFGHLYFYITGACNNAITRSGHYHASQFVSAANHERSEGSWAWENLANNITSIELNLDAGDFEAGTIYALYGIGSDV